MRLILFLFGVFLSSVCSTQVPFEIEKRDYIWLFGYGDSSFEGFGGSVLDFNSIPPDAYFTEIPFDFNRTNASICDKNGNILLFTNGLTIGNQFYEIAESGNGINPGEINIAFPDYYVLIQGAIILPSFESPELYYLFHGTLELPIPELEIVGYISKFNYTLVDADNDGLVLEKNIPIIEDTLSTTGITATRHANGRDWWMLMPKYDSNEYYSILFFPAGIQMLENQIVGDTVVSGLAQAVFSPNGDKYARFNTISDEAGQFIDIYDFDRCTGWLSNHITISYNDTAQAGGIAISPSSRYLYVSSFRFVYQYDLHAQDIEASRITVAEFDGFANPFPNNFFLSQLAPDDKIYINSSNGTQFLHRIEEPNRRGLACDLRQHSVELPTRNRFSLPNNPYYALGPLDGSPCDTLGIDNHPLAYFRHTVGDLQVIFTDYSKLAPTAWNWDFGDGMTSQEVNPIHTYAGPGIYEVCLTVSNAFNSHTYCDSVMVFLTNSTALVHSPKIILYPNPTKDQFTLEWQEVDQFLINGNLSILNMNGQVVQQEIIQGMQQVVSIQGLAAGVYTIVLTIGENTIKEKIVIIQ